MNRSDFQRLAEVRLREAETLLATGLWDGAYYLAGYAVECGLKACVAKLTAAEEFPPKPEVVRDYYSHDLIRLRKAARLDQTFDTDAAADPQLEANWLTVKVWSEQARYEIHSEPLARALVSAVGDQTTGVLAWLAKRW